MQKAGCLDGDELADDLPGFARKDLARKTVLERERTKNDNIFNGWQRLIFATTIKRVAKETYFCDEKVLSTRKKEC